MRLRGAQGECCWQAARGIFCLGALLCGFDATRRRPSALKGQGGAASPAQWAAALVPRGANTLHS